MFLGNLDRDSLRVGLKLRSAGGVVGTIRNIEWDPDYGPRLQLYWENGSEASLWFVWEQDDPKIYVDLE
jgi:hypothetical protein